ncbi:L-arabinose transport system permease protein AraQ [bioreactor metagenome]|uniref:L-arabinose transport system permease protein AraQ n=1 Tax=bioreactor metagenome TaxID=1076179 RepID=A0A645A4F6_9ZZZZ
MGWVGSFRPLIIPYYFATQGFFVYLIYNFIKGVPRDLDEAAVIDGCSKYGIFGRIMLPLTVPALITSGIFSFIWRWDDFLSALLYINSSNMYPVSLALKLFSDPSSSSDYGAMFAMATLSIMPCMIIFIFLQKYLVEGIATTGLKG